MTVTIDKAYLENNRRESLVLGVIKNEENFRRLPQICEDVKDVCKKSGGVFIYAGTFGGEPVVATCRTKEDVISLMHSNALFSIEDAHTVWEAIEPKNQRPAIEKKPVMVFEPAY